MKVPLKLLFVGWWMAGQSWMVTGQDYREPSISVSPEVVTLGGNVTVHCGNASHPHAEFSLFKGDPSFTCVLSQKARDYEAEFIISNTSISDAGIYRCSYYLILDFGGPWSHYSDKVCINVTDPSIPKPSIKVTPGHQNALRSRVTIECQGEEDGLTFFLRKENTGEISRTEEPSTATATFHFYQVKKQDAGSYICQYHRRNTPFVWSEPSDPLNLTVKDPGLLKPSIKVRPKAQREVGMKVTIECEGPRDGLTFSLHKSKNLTALQTRKAKGNTSKFSLPRLRPEDAGNYTCQYYHGENPFVSSEPSEYVQVVVTSKKLDKSSKKHMTIIWASVAAGLLLVLFLLALILVICKKRRKRSTVKEGNQPANKLLEQNAGTSQDDKADQDGVTYAVLNHHRPKTQQPAGQHAGPESCVYASVAKERKV